MQVRKRQGDELEEFPLIDVHASVGLHKTLNPISPKQTLSKIECVTPSQKFEWGTRALQTTQCPRITTTGGYSVELLCGRKMGVQFAHPTSNITTTALSNPALRSLARG